jgi:predicted TIM-barrel fold metal-dependent hydrolase
VEHRIAQEETVIVDTHVHPLAADRARYPLSPAEGSGPDWYTEMHFTAEECLAQMAHSGVDQMVLVSSYSAYTNDNSYAADAAASSPAHFAGVCRIDPLAPDAPDTLSYWIEERGMHGVRLGSAEARAYPVCERAQQLGIPVAIQVRSSELARVRQMAERFPAVQFILDHLAHPSIESGPPYSDAAEFFGLAALPNLYFKFSTLNLREASEGRSTPQAFVEALVTRLGPRRLLWGSDFPHSQGGKAAPYQELVELAREALAFLGPADREQILAGTARSLFPALSTDRQRPGC